MPNIVIDELERMAGDPRLRSALMRQPDLGFEGLATLPGVGLEEGPGLLPELLGEVGRGIVATPETAATLVSGGLSFVGGGYAGIAKRLEEVGRRALGLPPPETSALEDIEEAMKWTYTPIGKTAAESVEVAMKPIELAQDTSKWWGDKVEQVTGSPSFGATVATMMEATFLVGIPEAIKMPAVKTTFRRRMKQLRSNLKNAIRKDIRAGDTAYARTSDVLNQIVRESEEAGVNLNEVVRQGRQYKETAISGEPGREAINAEAQAAASTARQTMHTMDTALERRGIDTRVRRRSGNAVLEELRRRESVAEAQRNPVESIKPSEEPKLTTRLVKPSTEFEPLPSVEIPEFKGTDEALKFGKTATEEQLVALEERRATSEAMAKQLTEAGNFDAAFRESFRAQFAREAIEVQREPGRYTKREAKAEPGVTRKQLKVVQPKRAVTPEGISERHGVEYRGIVEDELGDQYYRFYDPQVGKNGYREGIIDLPIEDLKTLKSEVEALRDLNAEGARAEDLAAATLAKEGGRMTPSEAGEAYQRWKEGDTNVAIEDVEATIVEEINRRSPGDFDTPTEYRDYISSIEEVLGDIRRTKRQRAETAPTFRRVEHRPITDKAALEREMAKTETEFLDQLSPEEQAALEEQMASEVREVDARGLPEVWSDIVDFFGEFDEGSMSFRPSKGGRKHYSLLTDDQKAAILRVMNDARIAGVETARFLRETLLLADKDAVVIEHYIREAMNERLKGSSKAQGSSQPASISPFPPADETPIVKNPPTDKAVQNVPVTEREFGYVRDVPDLQRGQITAALENPERTFRTLDDTMPGDPFKEMIYWPYQAAEKAIAVEWENHFKPMLKELKKGLSWKDRKEVGAFAIAQQERGVEILKSMGVKKIPELSPAQMDIYKKLRSEFETFFDRINYVRQRVGKKPMKKVDNYFTFMRTFSLRDRMGTPLNPIFDSASEIFNANAALKATPFRFAKTRAKIGVLPVELDPFTIFETYAQKGLRHIHVSPVVAKVRALRTPFKNVPVIDAETGAVAPGNWHMQWRAPNLDNFLGKWANHVAGLPSTVLPASVERLMHRMNRNMTIAVLGANLRSAGIQVSALRNTWTEIGTEYTAKGIASLIDPKARNQMLEKSNVLTPRMFESAMADAKRVLGAGRISEGKKVVANLAMKPLQVLDMQTARATWQGAYLLAKEKLAMGETRAARYADDVVTRTQASAMAGDIAPIQRSALGRWITLFQTFGINDWGYLTRDVMGLTGSPTSPRVFKKAMGYIVATSLMNMLFEDLLHVNSPFPTPIRAFSEALSNNEDYPSATLRAAKELAEPIPLIGGGARYGTTPLGPNVQLLGETAVLTKMYPENIAPLMKALNKPYYELTGKWLGAPATSQIMKSMRAHKRGESTYGIIMGSYTKKGRRSKSGMRELSGMKSL